MSDHQGSAEPDDQPGDDRSARRPRGLVIALVAAAVAFIIIVIIAVLQLTGGGGAPAPAGGAATSPASSSTTGAEPGSPGATPPDGSTEPSAPGSSTQPTRQPEPSEQPKPGETRSPVPIKTPAEVKEGLTASITDVEAVRGKAEGPGEVAGPAVRFTLTLLNNSADEVPLNTTVVNLYYGKAKTPASPLSAPGGVPLPATVAAGGEASGTYVFVVPRKARNRVLITVDYSVDVSLVAFRGSVPR